MVPLKSGLKAHFTLWEADDQEHFPIRIESTDTNGRMILDLSDVRLEYPSQEIFSPPDGFTPYASSVALMNELIVRDVAKKHEFGEVEEGPAIHTGGWGGSGGTSPP